MMLGMVMPTFLCGNGAKKVSDKIHHLGKEGAGSPSPSAGGGNGNGGDIRERLARLEARFDNVEARFDNFATKEDLVRMQRDLERTIKQAIDESRKEAEKSHHDSVVRIFMSLGIFISIVIGILNFIK